MKADRDDRRDSYTNKPNKAIWIVAAFFATPCIGALAYYYVPKFHIELNQQRGSITITKRGDTQAQDYAPQIGAQARATEPALSVPVPPPELQVESYRQSAPVKQTVFNDSNYVPRGAVNSMAPPPQIAYNQQPRNQSPQITRRVHSARWEWEQGHDKRKVWGTFQWVEVNGSIQWGSVCQNYRSGSMQYRDCRKGAKVAFRNMCGSYRPACMAQNGFRP